MNQESGDIKYDMLENGLDFVTSGIRHIINDKSANSIKYAIIHLAAGVELILKDRLRKEHWSLIFDNINAAKLELLTSGDFRSVDFEAILSRLQNICGVELHEKHIAALRQLRKERNKIEHFELSINIPAIKSLASKVLSILLSYVNVQFESDELSDTAKEFIVELRTMPVKFNEFAKLRNAQIKQVIEDAQKKGEVEICPTCRQSALILYDGIECAFCGYTDIPQVVAELYAENILGASRYLTMTDGGEFPVMDCIHCGESDTFVDKGDDFICFACHQSSQKSDVAYCNQCGQLFEPINEEDYMCEDCHDYLWNKYD